MFDPIDGTKSFITGKPLWGTLIALLHNGEPVVGILDQPYLRERWVGVAGTPSTLNGAPISTTAKSALSDAYMYSTTPLMFQGANATAYERLKAKVKIPMYGCDCYAYGLLAAGFADLVVEADLKPYDYMALVPIVIGAGGTFTDWTGAPLRWVAPHGDGDGDHVAFQGEVVAAGCAAVHAAALDALHKK